MDGGSVEPAGRQESGPIVETTRGAVAPAQALDAAPDRTDAEAEPTIWGSRRHDNIAAARCEKAETIVLDVLHAERILVRFAFHRSEEFLPHTVEMGEGFFLGRYYADWWAAVQHFSALGKHDRTIDDVRAHLDAHGERWRCTGAALLLQELTSTDGIVAMSVEVALEIVKEMRGRVYALNAAEKARDFMDVASAPRFQVGLRAQMARESMGVLLNESDTTELKIDTFADVMLAAQQSGARLPWGVPALDRLTNGTAAPDLTVIGAGTSDGKSLMALRLASKQAEEGTVTAVISCEDGSLTLISRLLAMYSREVGYKSVPREPGFSASAIEARFREPLGASSVTPERLQAIQDYAAERLGDRLILVALSRSPINIVLSAVRMVATGRTIAVNPFTNQRVRYAAASVVYVDYLQKIGDLVDAKRRRTPQDMAAVAVDELKQTCHEYSVSMVLLSQLTRDGTRDHKEPDLHSCKYAGDIENQAEIMLLMWRTADGSRHLKIAKNKNGATGDRFILPFDPATFSFGCKWLIDTAPPDDAPPPRGRGGGGSGGGGGGGGLHRGGGQRPPVAAQHAPSASASAMADASTASAAAPVQLVSFADVARAEAAKRIIRDAKFLAAKTAASKSLLDGLDMKNTTACLAVMTMLRKSRRYDEFRVLEARMKESLRSAAAPVTDEAPPVVQVAAVAAVEVPIPVFEREVPAVEVVAVPIVEIVVPIEVVAVPVVAQVLEAAAPEALAAESAQLDFDWTIVPPSEAPSVPEVSEPARRVRRPEHRARTRIPLRPSRYVDQSAWRPVPPPVHPPSDSTIYAAPWAIGRPLRSEPVATNWGEVLEPPARATAPPQ